MKLTYAVALSGILSIAYGVSLNTEDQLTSNLLATNLAQVSTDTETRGRTKAKTSSKARGCSGSKECSKPKSGSKNKIIEAPIVEEVCEPGVQCAWGAYTAPVWSNPFAPMQFSFTRAPAPEPIPEPIFFEEEQLNLRESLVPTVEICEQVPVFDDFGNFAGFTDLCHQEEMDRGNVEVSREFTYHDDNSAPVPIMDDFGNIIGFEVDHDVRSFTTNAHAGYDAPKTANTVMDADHDHADCEERPVFDDFGNFIGIEMVCTDGDADSHSAAAPVEQAMDVAPAGGPTPMFDDFGNFVGFA